MQHKTGSTKEHLKEVGRSGGQDFMARAAQRLPPLVVCQRYESSSRTARSFPVGSLASFYFLTHGSSLFALRGSSEQRPKALSIEGGHGLNRGFMGSPTFAGKCDESDLLLHFELRSGLQACMVHRKRRWATLGFTLLLSRGFNTLVKASSL